MPVTLRTPNNPIAEPTLLAALKPILRGYPTPNTNLAAISPSQTGDEYIYINDVSAFALDSTPFPGVLLAVGPQRYGRNSRATFAGTFTAVVRYFDRWEQTTRTYDQVWADITTDLLRMQSNVETNDSLSQGGAAYTMSLPDLSLSPYQGQVFDEPVPGMKLIHRDLTLNFNILPYDALV